MSNFTSNEIANFASQPLGRLAAVNAAGEPHVVPVTYRYNPDLDTIDIGGMGLPRTKKYRGAIATGRAAFVVDDVAAPWQAHGIEVRGRAEVVATGGVETFGGNNFSPEMIRRVPRRVIGWGIDGDPFTPNSRTVG